MKRETVIKEKDESVRRASMGEGMYKGFGKDDLPKPEPPLTKNQFKTLTGQLKLSSELIKVDGLEHLGAIHDVEVNPKTKHLRFYGDRFMATVDTEENPPNIVGMKEISDLIVKCVFHGDLEVVFCCGKEPQILKEGNPLLVIENKYLQSTGHNVKTTNEFLYFKENDSNLVRVKFAGLVDAIAAKESKIKADLVKPDVVAYGCRDNKVWYMNKKGEIRGSVQAMLRLGPNILIDSSSDILSLGENMLVIWHSAMSKKNNYVLFTPSLQALSCLSVPVQEGKLLANEQPIDSCMLWNLSASEFIMFWHAGHESESIF